MSYTPTIIISYDDLVTVEDRLLDYNEGDKEPLDKISDAFYWAGQTQPTILKGARMVVINTETSSQNREIREALDDLGVEYTLYN